MEYYDSKTVAPLLSKHPRTGEPVIRYSEPPPEKEQQFLNPPDQEWVGIDPKAVKSFHQALRKLLYDPRQFYAHTWRDGDLLIADNFALHHGREAFTAEAPRHLQRIQVLGNIHFKNPGLVSLR
jgi:alpha-ketoglutarate-dependent taurine dioxygenase